MKFILIAALSLCLAACGGGAMTPAAAPTVAKDTAPTTVQSNPVIVPTQPWEANNIEDGSTIRVGDLYYHFYCAGDIHRMDIGFATATVAGFPRIWTKNPTNPVIHAAEFYSGAGFSACAPRVIHMPDGSFRMYVHAHDGVLDRGYLLTSTSFPSTWQIANNGQPIFIEGAAGQWDSYRVQTQSIIPAFDSPDGLWHLFYIGSDGNTFRGGHATSTDGITWNRDPANPVMLPDTGWKSKHIAPLGWFKKDATYYIVAQGFNGTAWSVGYYSTTDLIHLTPSIAPVLTGTPGTWDSSGIEGVDPFVDGSNIWLFYLGSNVPNMTAGGLQYRVGVASWK
jgi:predicted GH43/DUF377 family glycosyl hydrolase